MTQTQKPTRSEIFTEYNKMKAVARKFPNLVDPARINKALGLLLSNAYWTGKREEYRPTEISCSCKDAEFFYARKRKHAAGGRYQGPCKHSIAEMILGKIIETRKAHNVTEWLEARSDAEALVSWYN